MSRFWAGAGASDSDSDASEDSSSGYSSEEAPQPGANRWVAMSDSESSEDEARVVKSGKTRAMETFQRHIKNIKAAMKQHDYYLIQTEFDELTKAMAKAKQYLADGVPRPLVRMLVELEDYTAERLQDKEQFKKLSARQGRALNRMKLTLKKHNKAYQVVMDAYRENPIVSESEEEEEDDDDEKSDDESESSSSASGESSSASASAKSDADSESESEDDDEGSRWASDNESSSDDDDDEGGDYSQLKGRARWLKKNNAVTEKVVKNKEERAKQRAEAREKAERQKAVAESIAATKSVLPEESVTISSIVRMVREVAMQRGRKGKDNRVLLRQLEALYRLSLKFGPRVEVPILMHAISAQFALQRTMDDTMDTATWKSCASYLSRIATVLEEGYTLVPEQLDETAVFATVGNRKMKAAANASATTGARQALAADEKLVNPATGEVETEDGRAERLRKEKEAKMTEADKKRIEVTGSLSLHLQRLEEEYVKSLQRTSHHSPEYITRLRDESKLVELLTRFHGYFERQQDFVAAATLAQLRIEHIYYRHDSIARQVDRAARFYKKFGEASMLHPACITSDESGKNQTNFKAFHPASIDGKPAVDEQTEVDFCELMTKLTSFVCKHGTDQEKTRATICQVYHHALHDRFMDARDLLLMSHLQDTIHNCGDVGTMVLFNRMMVTLGMCAFRAGRITDSHQCLSDICSGRVRELLAQGVNLGRFNDKSQEQEKAEKRRQVPYHQHINLDLLEACHVISAMLLEVPNMAAAAVEGDSYSGRRARVISRSFRKYHDQYNHQVFTGPPEQTRDFVMRAAMALKKGDWKTCADLTTKLEVWQLVPGDGSMERIAEMLTDKIKLEALRTYLFTFSSQYNSLSLSQLCGMFDMTKNEVHSVVSKMMINRELFASWDQPTETIILRKVEPTSLQVMALQFSEKISGLVEANERLLDAQTGSYGYKDEHWKDDDRNQSRGGFHHHHRGGGRGGGGRGGGRGSGRGGSGGPRFRRGGDKGGYRPRGRRY